MRQIPIPPRLDQLPQTKFHLSDELLVLIRVLRVALREKFLLLFSSRGRLKPELLAIALMGFWPKRFRPTIIFYGEMYEPDPGLRGRIQRILIKLADRAVRFYVLHSRAEGDVFARQWNVNPDKMRVAPVFYDPKLKDEQTYTSKNQRIFAGGNSLRDYTPLVEAARLLPESEFVFATNRLADHPNLPANVNAQPIPQSSFYTTMATSSIVVIPLRVETLRGAGQMTFLAAMWMKKPTIVPDALGVREYIEHGVTGLVVDGSALGYKEALQWVLDPLNAEAVTQLGEQAHESVRTQFVVDSFVIAILAIMDEAMNSSGKAGQ